MELSPPPVVTGDALGATHGAMPDCAQTVELAAVLLDQTMEETDVPIAELAEALARMSQTLSELGMSAFEGARTSMSPFETGQTSAATRSARAPFAHDLAVCITSLQFHDRLMQQLVKVRELLHRRRQAHALQQAAVMPRAEPGSIELF